MKARSNRRVFCFLNGPVVQQTQGAIILLYHPIVHQYYIVYKPFNVLSQFSSGEGKPTLKDFFSVPVDLYPVGRLDFDSEGLLILTNDKSLNHRLLDPQFAH